MVFDKGFISYPWFRALGAKGVFFVTRLKRNAVCKLLEHRPVNRKTGVASDLITEVTSSKTVLRPRHASRRDPESGKPCKFLASHCHLSPKTTADIYRDCWQIELFFKKIKQDLRIKSLVDNSENAVLIQICTTLTVCPLLSTRNSSAAPGCPCGNFSSLSRSTCLARPP